MYEYRCKVIRVIDGDTVDVDIDLGFDIVLKDERVRIMGIDTPESRTRDKVEKKFGLASKARLKELIGGKSGPILKTQINKKGEDMRGKFGRILGDLVWSLLISHHAPEDRLDVLLVLAVKELGALDAIGFFPGKLPFPHPRERDVNTLNPGQQRLVLVPINLL